MKKEYKKDNIIDIIDLVINCLLNFEEFKNINLSLDKNEIVKELKNEIENKNKQEKEKEIFKKDKNIFEIIIEKITDNIILSIDNPNLITIEKELTEECEFCKNKECRNYSNNYCSYDLFLRNNIIISFKIYI